jgi:hypothetical protein
MILRPASDRITWQPRNIEVGLALIIRHIDQLKRASVDFYSLKISKGMRINCHHAGTPDATLLPLSS